MLALLGFVVDGIAQFGAYVLWGIETAFNSILAAIAAAAAAALALLPSMSDAPSIGTPTWLSWLNWFYPVGDLLAGLTVLLALWVGFLAVRFVLRITRAL